MDDDSKPLTLSWIAALDGIDFSAFVAARGTDADCYPVLLGEDGHPFREDGFSSASEQADRSASAFCEWAQNCGLRFMECNGAVTPILRAWGCRERLYEDKAEEYTLTPLHTRGEFRQFWLRLFGRPHAECPPAGGDIASFWSALPATPPSQS